MLAGMSAAETNVPDVTGARPSEPLDERPMPVNAVDAVAVSTAWLTDEQQQAWRTLAAVILKLPASLEQQLQRDSGLTHFEYWVLALLSERDDWTLRLSQLAAQANASLSRLSHVVTRLERRGWVHRTPCPDDGRANLATLTQSGYDKVEASAPGHVTHVKALIFEHLSPEDVDELERLCSRIAAAVEADSGG